jgi:F-type H+-transporting ATPase subunit b
VITLAATVVNPPSNPLIPELPELIIGAIAFLIVFGTLAKVLMPRIQKTLAERTDAIEGGLDRAEKAQAEAARTLEQYRAQLAEARHEASRLREEAKQQGAAIIAEMREQAQAEARRVTEAAQAQLQADRQQAIAHLRTEVGAMSVDLASKIVGESLADEARQRRLVDRFLDELEDQPASPESTSTSDASSSSPSGAQATS